MTFINYKINYDFLKYKFITAILKTHIINYDFLKNLFQLLFTSHHTS